MADDELMAHRSNRNDSKRNSPHSNNNSQNSNSCRLSDAFLDDSTVIKMVFEVEPITTLFWDSQSSSGPAQRTCRGESFQGAVSRGTIAEQRA